MKNVLIISVFAVAAMFILVPTTFAQDAERPDFTGLWGSAPGGGGGGGPTLSVYQGTADAPLRSTRRELGLDELPLSTWGEQVFFYYTAADGEYGGETGTVGDPRYHGIYCGGPYSPADLGNNMQIIQTPRLLQITYETGQPWIRKIWIGQEHPEDIGEYVPFWMGHSVGRWEGDTLVVDTVKIKTWEGSAISTRRAAPQSDNLHMIERFQLDADGRLQIETTYDDPITYTEPWSASTTVQRRTNWEDMQFDWEIEENHDVCEVAGGYWAEHDPWFDNFDEFADEILPDLETLQAGKPALPAGAELVEPFLGPFGEPR